MFDILASFDEKWERILKLLGQVDFTKAKLLAWIKAYYKKEERWREERIFSAYHEIYFGKNRDSADDAGTQEFVKRVAVIILETLEKFPTGMEQTR